MKDNGLLLDSRSFHVSAIATPDAILTIRNKIEREASKKAQFPGFRKGQVPPYAMAELSQFSLEEAITNTLKEVTKAYGIEAREGSAGNVDVKEDIKAIGRKWKKGQAVPFTATFLGFYEDGRDDGKREGEVNEEVKGAVEDAMIVEKTE